MLMRGGPLSSLVWVVRQIQPTPPLRVEVTFCITLHRRNPESRIFRIDVRGGENGAVERMLSLQKTTSPHSRAPHDVERGHGNIERRLDRFKLVQMLPKLPKLAEVDVEIELNWRDFVNH